MTCRRSEDSPPGIDRILRSPGSRCLFDCPDSRYCGIEEVFKNRTWDCSHVLPSPQWVSSLGAAVNQLEDNVTSCCCNLTPAQAIPSTILHSSLQNTWYYGGTNNFCVQVCRHCQLGSLDGKLPPPQLKVDIISSFPCQQSCRGSFLPRNLDCRY